MTEVRNQQRQRTPCRSLFQIGSRGGDAGVEIEGGDGIMIRIATLRLFDIFLSLVTSGKSARREAHGLGSASIIYVFLLADTDFLSSERR